MPAFSPLLVAEDNAHDMFLFTRLLKSTGALNALHLALDGDEAIRLLTPVIEHNPLAPKPLVAFLDVNLPHRDGFEVLQWIRSQRPLDDMPVVMMAATAERDAIGRAAQAGAQGFVIKFPGKPAMNRLLENAPRFTGRDGIDLFDVPENLLRSNAGRTYYSPPSRRD